MVGIYEMPDHTWVVTDGRSVSHKIFSCPSKGAVLAKIAEFLEAMQPAAKLSESNLEVEMTFIVTTQVSLVGAVYPNISESVREGLLHAVKYGEQNGFVHDLAAEVSIGVVSVDTLCID
jgi:hypothetical protein